MLPDLRLLDRPLELRPAKQPSPSLRAVAFWAVVWLATVLVLGAAV